MACVYQRCGCGNGIICTLHQTTEAECDGCGDMKPVEEKPKQNTTAICDTCDAFFLTNPRRLRKCRKSGLTAKTGRAFQMCPERKF